jgi:drug/metabolite transporter (DMT)-like permease
MTIQVTDPRRITKGYLIAFIGTIIWSSTGVLIRYLTNELMMPPIVLAFWRDLIVCAALILVLAVFSRKLLFVGRKVLFFLGMYGLLLALFNTTWTLSVFYNGAAVSTVLVYSSAAYTAVLGWRLFNERLDKAKLLAVSLSLGGCVLVSGAYNLSEWSLNPLGIITGLISGLAFAGYSLMGRHSSHQGIPPLTTLTYTFGFAAFFLFLFNLVQIPGYSGLKDLFWLEKSLTGWGALVFLAIGPTIGGYGLYTVSLGYLPASVANLIATLEPAFTAFQAYLFLGELMTGMQIIGSVVILCAVLFLRWYENRLAVQMFPV